MLEVAATAFGCTNLRLDLLDEFLVSVIVWLLPALLIKLLTGIIEDVYDYSTAMLRKGIVCY